VEALTCRLLPWHVADGPTNMAADDVLVRTAAEAGIASLRFYGWEPATLSLGYFQPASARLGDPLLAALPFVRRPSGGAALVHHHEVTYALALPAGLPWQGGEPWMSRMHRVIARALSKLGLSGQVHAATAAETARHGDVLCFQQFTPNDLLCAGMKVVGSAQRKYFRALMQHGSILLERSQHSPALPGLRELTGVPLSVDEVCSVVASAFAAETNCDLCPGVWTATETAEIVAVARGKYATTAWNERR
jgi:lipoate-protein ligase A